MKKLIHEVKETDWIADEYISPSGAQYHYSARIMVVDEDITRDTFVDAALSDKCKYHYFWTIQTITNGFIIRCSNHPGDPEITPTQMAPHWGDQTLVSDDEGEIADVTDDNNNTITSYSYSDAQHTGDLEFIIYYTNNESESTLLN